MPTCGRMSRVHPPRGMVRTVSRMPFFGKGSGPPARLFINMMCGARLVARITIRWPPERDARAEE